MDIRLATLGDLVFAACKQLHRNLDIPLKIEAHKNDKSFRKYRINHGIDLFDIISEIAEETLKNRGREISMTTRSDNQFFYLDVITDIDSETDERHNPEGESMSLSAYPNFGSVNSNGTGLAHALEVARKYNGDISLQRSNGKTYFRIKLPLDMKVNPDVKEYIDKTTVNGDPNLFYI